MPLVTHTPSGDILLHSPRAGGVYSRWSTRAHSPGTYGASVVAALNASVARGARVLALGLGGGAIQAELLCHGLAREVVTVEHSAQIAQLVSRTFFPAMFDSPACSVRGARGRMGVVLGDATNGTLLRSLAERGRFDAAVADMEPVYLAPATMPLPAWAALSSALRPRGLLVCNTIFADRGGTRLLAARLKRSGWRDTQAALVGPKWRPGANVLLTARSASRA